VRYHPSRLPERDVFDVFAKNHEADGDATMNKVKIGSSFTKIFDRAKT
jgi:hypothetical protein